MHLQICILNVIQFTNTKWRKTGSQRKLSFNKVHFATLAIVNKYISLKLKLNFNTWNIYILYSKYFLCFTELECNCFVTILFYSYDTRNILTAYYIGDFN